MAADIFTKHFVKTQKWVCECQLIGLLDGKRIGKLKSKSKCCPTGVVTSPACVAIRCLPALPVPPSPGEFACVLIRKAQSATVAAQGRENVRIPHYKMCEICDVPIP